MFVWQTFTHIFVLLQATVFCQIESIPKDIFYGPNATSQDVAQVENVACTCIMIDMCDQSMINMDGENLIEYKIDDPDSRCDTWEVCCTPFYTRKVRFNPTNTRNEQKGCGYRNPNGVNVHIPKSPATENRAQIAEFPWMVAIMRRRDPPGSLDEEDYDPDDTDLMYQCGGSLIHPKVVLTAAHCLRNRHAKYTVRAGEWDTMDDKEMYPHQDREVETIMIHPNFHAGTAHNDIALLLLQIPFEMENNIAMVCLPDQDDFPEASEDCFATGWGNDFYGSESKRQNILKKIQLPVVSPDTCQDNLRQTRLGPYFRLHESFMCAGGEKDKDTCNGDGGGPLVCPIVDTKRRYFQAGIVSWGLGCGRKDVPGVYVSVARFRNWIDEKMESFGLATSAYTASYE